MVEYRRVLHFDGGKNMFLQQDSTVLIHQWTWLGHFFTCNMQLSSFFASSKQHHLGVSENVVYPIVPNGFADHYPVFKWLFHWED